jgi:DNA primase
MKLLLQQPGLIRRIPDIEKLESPGDPDFPLFLKLAEQLRRNPSTSLGAVLGYWYGTPEGELLTRLAADEPVPGADPDQEFADVLGHLGRRAAVQSATEQLRELERIPYAELSAVQKQQYLQILRSRHK